MTEKTIPIEELAPFLPYGLEVIGRFGEREFIISFQPPVPQYPHVVINTNEGGHSRYATREYVCLDGLAEFKPLVRPMSALSKPLPNGNIPIVDLAKMAERHPVAWGEIETGPSLVCIKGEYGTYFEYSQGRFYFHCIHEIDDVPDQRPLFQELYKRHFDVHNWIGKGLALEKREHAE